MVPFELPGVPGGFDSSLAHTGPGPHDARHSCGTALHLRGVPLAVIAKWLGHADASVTARIYAHSQDDALKAAAQSWAQL